ncbi:hypothetical protein GCM10025868_26750 [Angustibacter aerolatus]|uniref:Uncharacterized protein n=1 Tax=Angustibacter aerolatus TaxID=1162965 RepID=A0ABQ6JJL9_9ACTN|nr:hypothetical protein GCM10025868_26750 [Angustibacter aerolatus]
MSDSALVVETTSHNLGVAGGPGAITGTWQRSNVLHVDETGRGLQRLPVE